MNAANQVAFFMAVGLRLALGVGSAITIVWLACALTFGWLW